MYRRINHFGNCFLSLRPGGGAGSKRESLHVLVPGTLASLREGEKGGTFQALLIITSLPGPEPQLHPTPMQLSVKDNFSSSELVFVPAHLRDWYAMSLVGVHYPLIKFPFSAWKAPMAGAVGPLCRQSTCIWPAPGELCRGAVCICA